MTEWTRDDLPSAPASVTSYLRSKGTRGGDVLLLPGVHGILDAVVEHLNAHHPKPDVVCIEAEVRRRTVALRENLHGVEKSRDEWERKYHEVRRELADEQGRNWGRHAAEMRIEQAERERDAAVARAEQAEQGVEDEVRRRTACLRDNLHGVTRARDEWERKYYDTHRELVDLEMVRTAPAVTREDIEGIIDHWIKQGGNHEALRDDLWRWVSGDDPAVYVVRKSALPHMEDDYIRNFDLSDGRGKYRNATDEEIREAREMAEGDLRWLIAVQQHIEAEAQAPDPVEAKAEELFEVAHPGATFARMPERAQDQYRAIARHVLAEGGDRDE